VRKSKSLDEEIEDDRSARKMDQGQLSKQNNTSLDALEHRTRRKERQAGEARKKRVKLTYGFRHLGFWYLGFWHLVFGLRLLVRYCNV
jgi:hypothetical protein